MPFKRIIACLDVKDGQVVKGVRFRNHEILGDAIDFAKNYREQSVDELVFYDIMASSRGQPVSEKWVSQIAEVLNIPFCVAGGIRTCEQARRILNAGADKISINSPALENPQLISDLANEFGSQCVVVGVDSRRVDNTDCVFLYSGDENKTVNSVINTWDWLTQVQKLGAGEVVFNSIDFDGVGDGYEIEALKKARSILSIPLVASGGAKTFEHFEKVFKETKVDAALAAGAFHRKTLLIPELKAKLNLAGVGVRLC
jgi:cyclase